jgi:hypothetical protein
LRATARGGLVGLGAHPFHEAGFVQSAHAHEHARDRAVATDPVVAAFGQAVLDHGHVDRVKDDDGVVFHAKRGGRVDPVAIPAGSAQFGENFRGVVAALRCDDDVALLQRFDVKRVFERFFVFSLCWGSAACVGGGEKDGFDHIEVFFGDHAVDQDRADHAAPAHEADRVSYFHLRCPFSFQSKCCVEATLPRLVCVRGGRKTNRAKLAFFGNGLGGDRAGQHASRAGQGLGCDCAVHDRIIAVSKTRLSKQCYAANFERNLIDTSKSINQPAPTNQNPI